MPFCAFLWLRATKTHSCLIEPKPGNCCVNTQRAIACVNTRLLSKPRCARARSVTTKDRRTKTSGEWSDCFTTSTTRCFRHADQHPFTGANILCGRVTPIDLFAPSWATPLTQACRAIQTWLAHSSPPMSFVAFSSRAPSCRPSRSLDDMEVSSVKKKLKDKAFARSVNRDDIKQGVEELGVNIDEHIRFVIDALRPVQKEIGLNTIAS